MTRRSLIKSLLILSVILVPSVALAGGNAALQGTWNVTAMTQAGKTMKPASMGMSMQVIFTATTYTLKMTRGKKTQTQTGTWSSKGNTISTVEKGKTKVESFRYVLKGKSLALSQKKMTLNLIKVVRKK